MILRRHLVAQWKLNDNAGTPAVLDTTRVYDGTLRNNVGNINTNNASVAGKIGRALTFDGRVAYGGSAEHVDCGNPFESVFQSSFSISLWALSTRRPIASSTYLFGVSVGVEEACVWINTTTIGTIGTQYTSNSNRARFIPSNVVFPVGQCTEWVHIILIHDHTVRGLYGLTAYINNVLGTTVHDLFRGNTTNVVSSDFQSTINPYLGAEDTGAGHTNEWCGALDNVMLFNKTLIESERDFLWNDGDGREDVWPEFPRLSTGIQIPGFTDEYGDEAVRVVNPALGYPHVNEIHRFDARNFGFQRRRVTQTDKLAVESFYRTNKSKAFYWTNEQDSTVYRVSFAHEPYCQLDGANNLWNMRIGFKQAGVV